MRCTDNDDGDGEGANAAEVLMIAIALMDRLPYSKTDEDLE